MMKGIRRWRRLGAIALGGSVILAIAGCDQGEKSGAKAAPESGGDHAKEEVAATAEPVPPAPPAPTPENKLETEPAEVPVRPAPERVPEAWTLQHAGFAAHLPADVDFYLDARELAWVWNMVEQAGLVALLEQWMESPAVEEIEGNAARELGHEFFAEAKEIVPILMSDEAFLAARGISLPMRALAEAGAKSDKMMGQAISKAMASGTFMEFALDGGFEADTAAGMWRWLLENAKKVDEQGNVAIYLGGRVAEEKRAEVAKRVALQLSKAAEESGIATEVSWVADEITWTGLALKLKEVEGFEESAALEGLNDEEKAQLVEVVGNWEIVVASAVVNEFVVTSLGLGRDSIALSESAEQSLAASSSFRFFKEFDAKALRGSGWASKDLLKELVAWSGSLAFLEGVEAGLKESPKLKHGAEMVKTVQEIHRHWRTRSAGVTHDYVSALLVDEEVRMESRGGWHGPGLDLVTPLKFAKVFDALDQDLFLRAHWKQDSKYVEGGRRLAEAGKNFVRLVSEELMDLAIEGAQADGDVDALQSRTRWKRDLLNGIDDLWAGYAEHFSKALGAEAAILMDLNGEMVPAVGVGEEMLKKGRIPRAAYVRPIGKRAALTEAWALWQRALTNMFGIVAEAFDQPIPFPDTMTADKDDLRTYFFPIPFSSDDFLPSVSLSEELFILGSSKALSESLYEASEDAKGAEVAPGLRIEMNAEPLWEFCAIWLDLYETERAKLEEMEEEAEEAVPGEPGDEPGLDRPVIPREGDLPAEPAEEFENPLLQELMKEPEGEAPTDEREEEIKEVPADVEPREDEEEMEEALEELGIEEFEEAEPAGPFGGLMSLPDAETMRSILAQARWLRGFKYHRWLENEVPRSTLRMKWMAP